MTWTMPAETAPQRRIWMAFPREGITLGETSAQRAAGYEAWSTVANQIADLQPVTMIVDPSETDRARRMLSSGIEIIVRVIDDFWLRDSGPTFVHAADGSVAAVDWVYNAWGAPDWSSSAHDRDLARFVAQQAGVPVVPSLLVNEGGGIHVDGAGTVFATETVQLDPHRNPHLDKLRVEEELARTLGIQNVVWFARGLTRDYDTFGTKGHVDIVATMPSPGVVLLHAQPDPAHPDHAVMAGLRATLAQQTDAQGRQFEIVDIPAPAQLRDAHGYVDYSYINHLVTNDAVIACGFGEDHADAQAREILASAYPGRSILSVDARELFARGGGIHCITQQEPKPR